MSRFDVIESCAALVAVCVGSSVLWGWPVGLLVLGALLLLDRVT